MSNINPNNIDNTFPIPGRDNDSRGFRDNFANIKSNFGLAKSELDQIQQGAVFKSTTNNMNNGVISNARLDGVQTTAVAMGLVVGSAPIDVSKGHFHTFTIESSTALGFSNWSPTTTYSSVVVEVNIDADGAALVLPAAVRVGLYNLRGYNPVTHSIALVVPLGPPGTYPERFMYEFSTSDGGQTITIVDLIQPREGIPPGLMLLVGSLPPPVGWAATGDTVETVGMTTLYVIQKD